MDRLTRRKISAVRYGCRQMEDGELNRLFGAVLEGAVPPALECNITELRQINGVGDRTAREILFAVALVVEDCGGEWEKLIDDR